VLTDAFPGGVPQNDLNRLLALGKDPDKSQFNYTEIGTAVRLEQVLQGAVTRATGPTQGGADFVDKFGRTWDAVGGGVTDQYFGNGNGLISSIDGKLFRNAADRIVVDLHNLNDANRIVIQNYVNNLSTSARAKILVVR
jgi:hypothetical protein